MDTDGKIQWKTGRNPNFDRGGMILADGLLLATDGLSTLALKEKKVFFALYLVYSKIMLIFEADM
jgi:hypothetical protein